MNTAKEYFYQELYPDQSGPYQIRDDDAILQFLDSIFDSEDERSFIPNLEERTESIFRKTGTHSNDPLYQLRVQDIIQRNCSCIEEHLADFFLGKVGSARACAKAARKVPDYPGSLVLLNVGLANACFAYSELFCKFVFLRHRIKTGPLNQIIYDKDYSHVRAPDVDLAKKFGEFLSYIGEMSERWRLAENEIEYIDTLEWERSKFIESVGTTEGAGIACTTDLFIVAHEIAHHLLGHTGDAPNPILKEEVDKLIRVLESRDVEIPGAGSRAMNEVQADISAILLIVGIFEYRNSWNNDHFLQAFHGAFITLTVLGQLVPSVMYHSNSYPSLWTRLSIVAHTLNHICDYYGTEHDYIMCVSRSRKILHFQIALYQAQGRGLGMPPLPTTKHT